MAEIAQPSRTDIELYAAHVAGLPSARPFVRQQQQMLDRLKRDQPQLREHYDSLLSAPSADRLLSCAAWADEGFTAFICALANGDDAAAGPIVQRLMDAFHGGLIDDGNASSLDAFAPSLGRWDGVFAEP